MRRTIIILLVGIISVTGYSQTVTIAASNKGIAPIAAFGNPDPVMFVSHTAKLSKHFEVSPDVAFSLKTGKLWLTDLWWRGNFFLDTAKKWLFTVGFDFPSYFGQGFMHQEEKIDQIVLYPTEQLRIKYAAHKNATIVLDYWYTKAATMKYGVKGSYLDLMCSWYKEVGKKFAIGSDPNVLYLDYSDHTKGFAASANFYVAHVKSGIFLETKGLVPLTVKNLDASYNFSLGITRKIYFK